MPNVLPPFPSVESMSSGSPRSSGIDHKWRFVCCEFLQGHCQSGIASCPYDHSNHTAKPCQHGEDCSLGHYHRNWVPDERTDSCQACRKEFTILSFSPRFRHHCRYCGHVVCGDCLDRKFSPYPICADCKGKPAAA